MTSVIHRLGSVVVNMAGCVLDSRRSASSSRYVHDGSVIFRLPGVLYVEQLEGYQPWIDNGRRLGDLAHELETLSLEAMRTAEGWNRQIRQKALREVRKRGT